MCGKADNPRAAMPQHPCLLNDQRVRLGRSNIVCLLEQTCMTLLNITTVATPNG